MLHACEALLNISGQHMLSYLSVLAQEFSVGPSNGVKEVTGQIEEPRYNQKTEFAKSALESLLDMDSFIDENMICMKFNIT